MLGIPVACSCIPQHSIRSCVCELEVVNLRLGMGRVCHEVQLWPSVRLYSYCGNLATSITTRILIVHQSISVKLWCGVLELLIWTWNIATHWDQGTLNATCECGNPGNTITSQHSARHCIIAWWISSLQCKVCTLTEPHHKDHNKLHTTCMTLKVHVSQVSQEYICSAW